jgi:hypothetical protein
MAVNWYNLPHGIDFSIGGTFAIHFCLACDWKRMCEVSQASMKKWLCAFAHL